MPINASTETPPPRTVITSLVNQHRITDMQTGAKVQGAIAVTIPSIRIIRYRIKLRSNFIFTSPGTYDSKLSSKVSVSAEFCVSESSKALTKNLAESLSSTGPNCATQRPPAIQRHA